jgi:hypothetical protein
MTLEELRFTLRIVSMVAAVVAIICAVYGLHQVRLMGKIIEKIK